MKQLNRFSIAIFFALTFFACKKSTTNQTMFYGDAVSLGSGSMKSWIKTDNSGKPISIGFTINEAAITALPSTDTMYMLMMPMMSGSMANMSMPSPFDHLEIDWAPNGDAGSTVFNHPHLDCHFFTINSTTQMGIMMGMDTSMIGANYMPQDCMADYTIEANMGVHVWDTLSPEYHGTPFDHTFMYGFYHGNMAFIEVLCTKSFLDTKANYTGNIAQPAAFKVSGYYPLKYSVSYNASTKEYSYSLDNLTSH